VTGLALVTTPEMGAIENVLVRGDLAQLTETQRVSYYNALCKSLGLNPLTQPFAYITLQGKLTLYAKRDATEQLRKLHGVSIERLEKERADDLYIVTAYAKDATGRTDASTGAVPLGGLKGEALANAIMKCETKAKRRVTLSICGLGLLDETEVDSIAGARALPVVNVQTGEEAPTVSAPDGFAAWFAALEGVADEGSAHLGEAWRSAPAGYRPFVVAHHAAAWSGLKARAAAVDVGGQ